ncbi:MAG: magnesium transporter [Candidatus Diapherotrites archaeon]|uniref:Magnesium transporter n=1 Tax=Candidatus Iainarchaeum sp. TaxID=3101447 RepID=A0A8T4LC81_9ARCH|nr:magnesium transporter [Candidatus Diapherotrites archaeon]
MGFFDKDFFEILSAETVSLFGGLVVGTILLIYTGEFLLIPGMLILLPGFFELRGNISGSFAARLSSGLFLGVIDPYHPGKRIIGQNLLASFLLAIVVSLALGLIAFLFIYFAFSTVYPRILLISVIAGVIANAIEIPLTLYATFILFRKGHDPNNIMGPFVSVSGDVISLFALIIAVLVV